ncbi:MAG: hypothetical protein FGF53_01150, partial [Candidatus Brockarchaeota archaeon]|nr:hypothetical protein [Candidatus Brockarchaeota archaeon]
MTLMPALSGRRMVEMGVVEGLRSVEEQVQPAGVDLTLEKIEVLVEEGEIGDGFRRR